MGLGKIRKDHERGMKTTTTTTSAGFLHWQNNKNIDTSSGIRRKNESVRLNY